MNTAEGSLGPSGIKMKRNDRVSIKQPTPSVPGTPISKPIDKRFITSSGGSRSSERIRQQKKPKLEENSLDYQDVCPDYYSKKLESWMLPKIAKRIVEDPACHYAEVQCILDPRSKMTVALVHQLGVEIIAILNNNGYTKNNPLPPNSKGKRKFENMQNGAEKVKSYFESLFEYLLSGPKTVDEVSENKDKNIKWMHEENHPLSFGILDLFKEHAQVSQKPRILMKFVRSI